MLRGWDEDNEWSSNSIELVLRRVTVRSCNLNAVLFSILLPFFSSLKLVILLLCFIWFSQHKLICHFHYMLHYVVRFLFCSKRDFYYLKLAIRSCIPLRLLLRQGMRARKKPDHTTVRELLCIQKKRKSKCGMFFFRGMKNVVFEGYFCSCAAYAVPIA